MYGYARSPKEDADFRAMLRPFLLKQGDEYEVDRFLEICTYHKGQYNSAEDMARVSTRVPARTLANPIARRAYSSTRLVPLFAIQKGTQGYSRVKGRAAPSH